ncbi:TPA: hypothetical protein MB315_004504 [Klebsiella quasipneumoniae subsp. similipneumoniae]|nr:hypothetical protein [Klebsiella quasipneumoniae subsp. similipneumoniae]
MMSIGSVKSAGSAGNYYTDKDNYYVIGSMDERWQGTVRPPMREPQSWHVHLPRR